MRAITSHWYTPLRKSPVTQTIEIPGTKHLLPITTIARKLGLGQDDYDQLGPAFAKLHLDLLHDPAHPPRGKLILVTATTPTASGEGKTVTSIGLAQGLERLGRKAIITPREPSLGPVFGMKGGAAGGGLSQVEPSQKINLHFTGDFHAITSAHNLLAALIDAHLFHGNDLHLDPANIWWPRAMDMNDRALRAVRIEIDGKRDGANRRTSFVITAASEIMAILALAKDRADLRRRLGAIVVGATRDGKPVTAADLHATGAMMALLADALLPNLVQTTEGTPALVHTGPFGNIAHGTSSIIAQQMGLRLADYVINEAGFAADLGAEKYIDIVMQVSGVSLSDTARAKLSEFVEWGYAGLPICVAKTQYSFTDDPKRLGAPTDWTLHINDVSLSAGAGFLVPVAGNMMLMPGLPKVSRAEDIDVDDQGAIIGV